MLSLPLNVQNFQHIVCGNTDLTLTHSSRAGFCGEVFGYHDPSNNFSPPVVVISDVFIVELSIGFMDTVGTIVKYES